MDICQKENYQTVTVFQGSTVNGVRAPGTDRENIVPSYTRL